MVQKEGIAKNGLFLKPKRMRTRYGTIPFLRVRFLNVLYVTFILALFSSCVTQRRCVEKFPPITTIDTVETILIVDTTIYVRLPADMVVDSILVEVEPDYSSEVVSAKAEYGSARAWINDGKLRLQLTMNDTLIAYRIDSLALVNTKTITVEKERVLEVKKVPPFYKATLYIAILLFVLVLCLFFLALRKRM